MSTDRIRYGRTDLMVSRICQGTAFRNMPRSPGNQVGLRVLRHCLDVGLNFFDTAPGYGAGGSEQLLGNALAGRRHEAVIANRVINVGVPPGSTQSDRLAPATTFSDRRNGRCRDWVLIISTSSRSTRRMDSQNTIRLS